MTNAPAEPTSSEVAPTPDWVERLRAGDHRRAAQGFDQLHPSPATPALKLARAKMAFELEEHELTVELTRGLAQEFPFLGDEIERWHWRARAEHAPDLEVARHFAASAALDDKLMAVALFAKLGAIPEAIKLVDTAVDLAGRGKRSGLAAARRARADLLRDGERRSTAQADYRWLTLEAVTEGASEGADEQLEKLGEKLTKAQRFARAEEFTSSGMVEAMERELRLMNDAPGPAPRGVDVLRTRAWGYYKSRKDYAKASEWFGQCAQLEATHRVQDLFYSARALSRAHRDAEAIERYEKIARDYPTSGYAEEARFLAARLHFVLGQWPHAERKYSAYLERVRRKQDAGRFAASARHQRAIAQLAMEQGAKAEPELRRLSANAADARSKAALSQLHAVALLQQGEREAAAAVFRKVIDERPLSLGALLSAARLRDMGLSPPPVMPPAEHSAPAEPASWQLPDNVSQLVSVGLDDYAERLLANQAREFKGSHAPRGGEALCEAYGALAPAFQRFRLGQRVVRERALMRPITPATRWLWECNFPTPYSEIVEEAAKRQGVSASLTYAIMRQESAFAPRVGSSAGAVGLMQLIRPTAERAAKELGLDPATIDLKVPATNVQLGTFYLGRLLRMFGGNVALAASGYNAGPGAAARWLEAAGDQPLDVFTAFIPYRETRHYVRRVIGNWARYDYLRAGPEGVARLSLELPKAVSLEADDY
jgi:soluble lytic murein transglycosylase